MNDIEQKAFEDESTIHFGGDGEEIDFFAGFDDDAGTQAAPTTEQQSAEPEDSGEAEESAAQDGDGTEAPTTEQQSAEPEKLTFKAKIDHQEQDVSIEADELPTIYQKAQNMDRAVQRANKAQQDMEQYRNSMEEIASMARALGFNGDTPEAAIRAMMTGVTSSTREQRVEALVNDGTAKEVAEFIVDQQMKPVPAAETHEPEAEEQQQDNEPDIQDEAAGDVDDGSQPPSPELNAITGKYILAETDRQLELARQQGLPIAAIDAINLLEGDLPDRCDVTVAVTAPVEIRVKRLMVRDQISEEYARLRISAQQPNEYFEAHCDYTLRNGEGTQEAFAQNCRELFTRLLEQQKGR